MATWITLQHPFYLRLMPLSPSPPSPRLSPSPSPPHRCLPLHRRLLNNSRCVPIQQNLEKPQGDYDDEEEEEEGVILCDDCEGKGWLLCDFCKGEKTNIKSDNKRIYRRCPSCRAVGYVLCRNCKVFKCVTFPSSEDGDELSF
ncbi:unnamed protein product [Cochlearia groenlandica]